MMDIGISGATPAADSSAVVKGTRGKDSGSAFDDALSQASGRDRGASTSQRDDDKDSAPASTSKAASSRADTGAKAGATTSRTAKSGDVTKDKPAGVASDQDEDAQAAAGTSAASVIDQPSAGDQAQADTTGEAASAALAAMLASAGLGADEAATESATSPKGEDGDAEGSDPSDADGKQAASDVLTLLGGTANPATLVAPSVAAAMLASNPVPTPTPQPVKAGEGMSTKSKASDTLSALSQTTDTSETDDADAALPAVKVARADGSGRTFDLSLSRSHDEDLDIDTKASGAGSIDLTVLDQRRYLGLASGTNSATILGTLGSNGEWASAMSPSSELSNQALWTSTGKVVNTLKIQLHPQDLGTVTATMRLSGEELSIDLKVHTTDAYRQLSNDQSHILDALRSQGYTVDRVTVSMASSGSNDANTGAGAQGQQQAGANQNQGGEAQSRRQGYSEQQANGNDSNWSAGDAEANDGAGGALRRGSTGGVYL